LVVSVAGVPHDEDLNITFATIFAHIENSTNGNNSEQDIKGLFSDVETNSPKLGNTVTQRKEKLVKILNAIVDINELNQRIAGIVERESKLRAEIDKIVAELAEMG
jgi:type I restriction enzyme M protein